jgi:hypothetical protein
MKGDDALNISNAKKSDAASSPSTDDVLHSVIATPDKRPRRKSMARRSGQGGYVERKGNAFYVRFRIDVPGQEKRAYKSVRICPAFGPGKMTKPERERRAKLIIAESGADTEGHFKLVAADNLGVTFKQQAERFMTRVQNRKRRPIKPATAQSWMAHSASWSDAAFCRQQSGSEGTGVEDVRCGSGREVNQQLSSNREDDCGVSGE